MTSIDPTTSTADREIRTTRLLNAPRELVWKAWTTPEHLTHWFGPRGFTTTTHSLDLRPGGEWRLVMVGPDGRKYPNKWVFIEIVEPERLVYDHMNDDGGAGLYFRASATFGDIEGKTEVTLLSVFNTKEECDITEKAFGAVEGARQTLDRLSEYLESLQ